MEMLSGKFYFIDWEEIGVGSSNNVDRFENVI